MAADISPCTAMPPPTRRAMSITAPRGLNLEGGTSRAQPGIPAVPGAVATVNMKYVVRAPVPDLSPLLLALAGAAELQQREGLAGAVTGVGGCGGWGALHRLSVSARAQTSRGNLVLSRPQRGPFPPPGPGRAAPRAHPRVRGQRPGLAAPADLVQRPGPLPHRRRPVHLRARGRGARRANKGEPGPRPAPAGSQLILSRDRRCHVTTARRGEGVLLRAGRGRACAVLESEGGGRSSPCPAYGGSRPAPFVPGGGRAPGQGWRFGGR